MKELKKSINTFQLTTTTLSGMIGVGWLFGSYIGMLTAGQGSLISWIFAGFAVLLISFIFIEMTISLPLTGSYVQYPNITHGELAGFIMSWTPWLSCVMAAPTEAHATIQYAKTFLPWLMTGDHLSSQGKLCAIALLTIFTYANYFGLKFTITYSKYLTYWKVFIPILTLALFAYNGQLKYNHHLSFNNLNWDGIFEFTSSMCIFSFLGFLEATAFVAEVKNPKKTIPFAIIGSIIFCTMLYLLMQWTFIQSIPNEWTVSGWQNIHFQGDNAPFASIASHIGLTYLCGLIYLDAMITPTGTAVVYTASTARMVMAMGQNKHLSPIFAKLNSYRVPHHALTLNLIIGILLLLILENFNQLIKFQSSAMMLAYSMGPCSFLALRKKLPNLERPFKILFPETISIVVFVICNVMIYYCGWEANKSLFLVLIAGSIGYIAFKKHEINQNIWLFLHWFFIIIISLCGNYDGGLKIIPKNLDILIIIIESAIMLYFSIISSNDKKNIEEKINIHS